VPLESILGWESNRLALRLHQEHYIEKFGLWAISNVKILEVARFLRLLGQSKRKRLNMSVPSVLRDAMIVVPYSQGSNFDSQSDIGKK
jgi:hypothetical protein